MESGPGVGRMRFIDGLWNKHDMYNTMVVLLRTLVCELEFGCPDN